MIIGILMLVSSIIDIIEGIIFVKAIKEEKVVEVDEKSE
jgi:hypothetical protein